VAVDVRAHLDLLDLDDLLVLARLGRLLLVGVFQLAEVEDLDDGRRGVGRNLDEIETGLFGGWSASLMETSPWFEPSTSISWTRGTRMSRFARGPSLTGAAALKGLRMVVVSSSR
jgi:hypothetical protein